MKKLLILFVALLIATSGAAIAENLFHIPQPAALTAGEVVEVPIMGMLDADCKGYSLSIRFDPAALEVQGCVCEGCACADAAIVQGCDPADLAAGMFKYGVVYSFSCPPTMPAGEHCLVKLLVRPIPHALNRSAMLSFEDIDLSKNRLTACDGSTLEPTTVNERFRIYQGRKVRPPLPPSRHPDNDTPKQAIEPR